MSIPTEVIVGVVGVVGVAVGSLGKWAIARATGRVTVRAAELRADTALAPPLLARITTLEEKQETLATSHAQLLVERAECLTQLAASGERIERLGRRIEVAEDAAIAAELLAHEMAERITGIEHATRGCAYRDEPGAACATPVPPAPEDEGSAPNGQGGAGS